MAVTKIGMRSAWFQVHKWIGLILAVLIIPLCISGSLLVWHDALDEALNPQRYAVSSDSAALPPQAYVAAASAVLAPGERISAMRLTPGEPVTVTATRAPPPGATGRPPRTLVWLDPGSARVLDKADGQAGFVRFMHVLHGSLMVPGVGRQIVGWLGVAMLLSSLTGLWLWWPTAGSWTRGLRWRRHRNFDTNLHHQFGFWIALPLFVLSLTGAWISFPAFFAKLSGEQSQQRPGGGGDARRARPIEAPSRTPEAAFAAARARAAGELTSLAWPTDRKPEWTVTLKQEQGRPVSVLVDDATGAARIDRKPAGQNGIARTMRKIHDGTDMGLLWQVIIFLGGILPAALAVTGITMWWRARGWRADLAGRRGRAAVPAE